MTNNSYRTPQNSRPINGEIIDSDAMVPGEVLPGNSLIENMRPNFSLRGALEKSRLKAELCRQAYDIYRKGVVTAMAQEMDVHLYARGLRSAAAKNAFLARHIEENNALAAALHQQVVTYIDQMSDRQVGYMMEAETKAQEQIGEVRRRIEAGALPSDRSDKMIAFIEEQKADKLRRILAFSDRDLEKLSQMAAQAQETVLKSLQAS